MSYKETETHVCASEVEAIAEIQKLGPGWAVLPADEPERGLLSYVVFREPVPEGEDEEGHEFAWPIFDRPLEPDEQVIEASELLTFSRNEKEFLVSSDDPKRLLIGFVSYRDAATSGRAVVRRTKISSYRRLSDEDRATIEELRMGHRNPSRIDRAQAIQGTLSFPFAS